MRRPNEKGHVEHLLDFARKNYLVPVPRVDSLETLNHQLVERCQNDLKRQLRGKPSPKQVLLVEEQQCFFGLAEADLRGAPLWPGERRFALPDPVRHQQLFGADEVCVSANHDRRDCR